MKTIQKRVSFRPLYVLIAFIVAAAAIHVWIDRLFGLRMHVALGYGAVYSTNMVFELVTRYGGAVLYLLLAIVAVRPFRTLVPSFAYPFMRILAGLLGFAIGYGLWSLDATSWLLFLHHVQFPITDPIFHMNEAFYVYQLPIYMGLLGRLITTVLLLMIVRSVFLMVVYAKQQLTKSLTDVSVQIRRQVRLLLGLASFLFICFAGMSILNRYNMVLTSSKGTYIFGPDYVTAKLTLPIFSWIHIACLILIAVSLAWLAIKIDTIVPIQDGFASLSLRAFRRPLQAGGLYVGSLVVTGIIGGLVGTLYVHPNENTVELPYIKNTIDATRFAFGIDKVQIKPFTPTTTLTSSTVANEGGALKNVRINDQGQTTAIYDQLQSFKNYFQFTSTSVDRYNDSEVYVSARQMDQSKLPVQTWINQTLVYTHGYGLAMSPVNEFDENGLPTMWAKNTPQETKAPIPNITTPDIYFGMMDNNVIAPSKQGEFDYPIGSVDHVSHYTGGEGLSVPENRWLLALEEGSLKFFTSDQITSKSQWLFDRNIYTRVSDIAPFLRYDQDAFPFVDGKGHVEWMLDAYTQSNNIPYAEQFLNAQYIRNSVKVVMDAYTGKTTFYVIDKSDPMIQSLMQVYPSLFTTDVPDDIAAHFRYPTDLFQAQSTALTRYHMTDPSSFYNQEDLWDLAQQIYQQNQTTTRPPAYQMIREPDKTKPEFVLSELFTPHEKQNLNGWLIADNEQGHYGELSIYQFPQDSLVFGPMQAENQIDSDPRISAQLSLWNQQGSRVVRGDVLLIPVGNAILYVEPVYLVASRQNSLPQLERVIVDFNQQVYINNSLGAAMNDLLQSTNGSAIAPNTPQTNTPSSGTNGTKPGPGQQPPQGQNAATLVSQANQWFQQYEADTAKGDFEAAGKDLKQLGDILTQLKALNTSKK